MSAAKGSPGNPFTFEDSDSEGDGTGKGRGGKTPTRRGGKTPTPRGGKAVGSRVGNQEFRPKTPVPRTRGKKATPKTAGAKLGGSRKGKEPETPTRSTAGGTRSAPVTPQGDPTKVSGGPLDPDLKLGLIICPTHDPYLHIRTLPLSTIDITLPYDSVNVAAISTVHSLQADMQSWVEGASLATALETLSEQLLPPALRDMVYVANWEDDNFFQFADGQRSAGEIHQSFIDRVGAIALRKDGRVAQRQLHQILRAAWSVLTLNVNGNHWVTLIIHMAGPPPAASAEQNPHQYYRRISRISVIDGLNRGLDGPDPWTTPAATRPIYERIEAMLRGVGSTFPGDPILDPGLWRREIWRPRQTDLYSCGVRAYTNVRHVLARLASAWQSQEDPSVPPFALGGYPNDPSSNDGLFFGPLPGWFHYELERWEMLGGNAGAVVRKCNYQARVAIEVVQRSQDSDGVEKDAPEAMNVPRTPTTHQVWPGGVKAAARAGSAGKITSRTDTGTQMTSPPPLFRGGFIPPAMRPKRDISGRSRFGSGTDRRIASGSSTNSSLSVIDLTQKDGANAWQPMVIPSGSSEGENPPNAFARRRNAPQAIIYNPAAIASSRVSSTGSGSTSSPPRKRQRTDAGTSDPFGPLRGTTASQGDAGRGAGRGAGSGSAPGPAPGKVPGKRPQPPPPQK